MVTKEDIEHVAKLMRIEIENPDEYFERIQKILNYFDTLDEADIESEEISVQEVSINDLREDKYIPFESKLISELKHYKGNYIRAPKMN
ncbi:MAG: Asp-tRNA(Asn)/Glu-tRNA(Gln) amidotransferase subunit GatC [Thermoproteota archaeon]|jgi:aspartyl-tRNA(Asn)/glutamyl-tRNA(Gln) amidotransferase subunit C